MVAAKGIITADGAAVRVGAAVLPLPATKTPAGAWVAATVAAYDAGELLPCRHCGRYGGCDCEDWLEFMAGAEHAPLDVMTDEDLPY